jgi:hypothetical protein
VNRGRDELAIGLQATKEDSPETYPREIGINQQNLPVRFYFDPGHAQPAKPYHHPADPDCLTCPQRLTIVQPEAEVNC